MCAGADVHGGRQREDGVINEAVNQVAFADKILLNKIDLVNAQEKASVLSSIRSINAVAKVIETTQSRANLDEVPPLLCRVHAALEPCWHRAVACCTQAGRRWGALVSCHASPGAGVGRQVTASVHNGACWLLGSSSASGPSRSRT